MPVQTFEHEHHPVEVEREGLFIHLGRRRVRLEYLLLVVLRGGLAAGLVDVKVVRFSGTHTASKFVIRKAERGRVQ